MNLFDRILCVGESQLEAVDERDVICVGIILLQAVILTHLKCVANTTQQKPQPLLQSCKESGNG